MWILRHKCSSQSYFLSQIENNSSIYQLGTECAWDELEARRGGRILLSCLLPWYNTLTTHSVGEKGSIVAHAPRLQAIWWRRHSSWILVTTAAKSREEWMCTGISCLLVLSWVLHSLLRKQHHPQWAGSSLVLYSNEDTLTPPDNPV